MRLFTLENMGQQATKELPKIGRKAGDPMNLFNLKSVHTEVIYPTNKRIMNFSICRCWQSTKFPICDNAHKTLQKQGCDCGPAMLEVRQAPSLKPVGAECSSGEKLSGSGERKNGFSPSALFGGAASVSAVVAAGAHTFGFL